MKKLFLLFVTIAIAGNAYAAKDEKVAKASKAPVNIESDSLVYESKTGAAIFTGNVRVLQEGLEITADKMKVFSDKKTTDSPKPNEESQVDTDFKRIEATGNVHFKGQDSYGNSDEAIFEIKEEILTLLGNVYLNQKGNELYGEKFIYNMKKERYDVYNNAGEGKQSGRVKLILNQSSKGDIKKEGTKKFKSGAPKLEE